MRKLHGSFRKTLINNLFCYVIMRTCCVLKGILRHSSRSDGDHETLSHTSWPVITPLLLSPQVAVTVYLNTQRRCSLNSCRALTICPVLPAGIRACLLLVCASISHQSCLNLTLHFNPPHLRLSV